MKHKNRIIGLLILLLFVTLACDVNLGTQTSSTTPTPASSSQSNAPVWGNQTKPSGCTASGDLCFRLFNDCAGCTRQRQE